MAISNANQQLALVVSSNSTTSYEELLESQKELISKQIYELQNIVSKQCKLTGVNPLSQEMQVLFQLKLDVAYLSIPKTKNSSCCRWKRPRDLLNPKAIKYMQSIFSVKDEINKKEIRAISALFGLTATQVRDFFNGQRSRVRRFIRLSREKAIQSTEGVQPQDGSLGSKLDPPNHPVPLNYVGPSSIKAPSCSMQDEVLPDTDDAEKYFIANIFNLLRKEETFSGQVKLMEWILQIQNASVLYWFLTNGGVMILASWLSQAAIEEQTTVLYVILRVLCHLPLHRALPAHMSAILQSVNKLRFYRGSDVSNRAKSLLSRWSKMFARSQAMRRPNANISSLDAQNEMLLKQRQAYLIGEIMEDESLESRIDNPVSYSPFPLPPSLSLSLYIYIYMLQPIKLLTGPSDDSNTKLLKGVSSSHSRERRKVQLVEQPGQKPASRGPQVTRIVSTNRGRPLSADDIQKAKMRAQFMRSKYGESYISPQMKTEVLRPANAHLHPKVEEHASSSSMSSLAIKPHDQPKVEELKSLIKLGPGDDLLAVPVHGKEIMDLEEPVSNKCKRLQIPWVIPPEMKINKEWSVCSGENSKEVDVQTNRIRREKEVFYNTVLEIPLNPKEPWDQEMEYDDSLTPEIPTDQLPDDDDNMVAEPAEANTSNYAVAENNNRNMPGPDLELLTVLLKNPEIVFALTAGQGGSLSNEQMVRLLDAMKANAARGGSIDSLVDGLVERKAEEARVEVSLPSPTPSSNPGTTIGWRQESSKNLFPRQSVTVNGGDSYDIPRVYFQETTAHRPTDHLTISPAVHHRFSDHSSSSSAYLLPEQQHSRMEMGVREAGTNYNASSSSYGSSSREFENRGPGPSRVRNTELESWSPNNSPDRSHEYYYYVNGHNHRNSSSYSQRPEMARMPPRYQNRGGRNDGSWWRERRR
ncbi:hypothetical protein SSX86_008212 [Deinandra increscens subsp. villosa]|uniref:Homeobox domain-containing protein n=1 Tax=Deinandra increscens subsp. villosa TaxID=3103831 RepID=A0AAP0DIQ1_9ASTR